MSFETATLRCRNCKFWWPLADGDQQANRQRSTRGYCRRFAPPALLKDKADAIEHYPAWAITLKEDWCGEHLHTEM